MKRFFKCIFVLIFLTVCTLGILFLIDYSRASEGKAPLFCIKDSDVNDGGTVIYSGVFYKVIDYHKTINYQQNIYYDDVKIGTYGMKYEDYESEWNKLLDEYKEKEYVPVSTDQQSSIKDVKSGIVINSLENAADIDALIDQIEFKNDSQVDADFQYELFVSSKNTTYALGYFEENEEIKGGLLKNTSDSSYAYLTPDIAKTLVELIQTNLK